MYYFQKITTHLCNNHRKFCKHLTAIGNKCRDNTLKSFPISEKKDFPLRKCEKQQQQQLQKVLISKQKEKSNTFRRKQ